MSYLASPYIHTSTGITSTQTKDYLHWCTCCYTWKVQTRVYQPLVEELLYVPLGTTGTGRGMCIIRHATITFRYDTSGPGTASFPHSGIFVRSAASPPPPSCLGPSCNDYIIAIVVSARVWSKPSAHSAPLLLLLLNHTYSSPTTWTQAAYSEAGIPPPPPMSTPSRPPRVLEPTIPRAPPLPCLAERTRKKQPRQAALPRCQAARRPRRKEVTHCKFRTCRMTCLAGAPVEEACRDSVRRPHLSPSPLAALPQASVVRRQYHPSPEVTPHFRRDRSVGAAGMTRDLQPLAWARQASLLDLARGGAGATSLQEGRQAERWGQRSGAAATTYSAHPPLPPASMGSVDPRAVSRPAGLPTPTLSVRRLVSYSRDPRRDPPCLGFLKGGVGM